MELALRGVQVGPGHEVILAAYDFPGNFRSIESVGAKPVLVDVARDSWCIDPDALDEAYSDQTRAVIVSHLHGSVADMPRICSWAKDRGIAVIEDACQSHGATVYGRPAGGWGDVATLSFGGSKLLSAGRGGAVLAQDVRVAQRITVFCERGNDAFPLSALQACVLLPQWRHLERLHEQRALAVEAVHAHASRLQGLGFPASKNQDSDPAYYKLGCRIGDRVLKGGLEEIEGARHRLLAFLGSKVVECGVGFHGFLRRSGQRCRVVGSLDRAHQAACGTVVIHHEELLGGTESGARLVELLGSWLEEEQNG